MNMEDGILGQGLADGDAAEAAARAGEPHAANAIDDSAMRAKVVHTRRAGACG